MIVLFFLFSIAAQLFSFRSCYGFTSFFFLLCFCLAFFFICLHFGFA